MGLKKLLVTEQRVTEEVLERILSGYVLLAQDTRRVIFTPEGMKLAARAKVLLALAARHAWRFVEQGAEQDTSVSLTRLEEETGLPGNTVRPTLKALKDRRVVESPGAGVYRLPPHALAYVEEEIGKTRRKDEPRAS